MKAPTLADDYAARFDYDQWDADGVVTPYAAGRVSSNCAVLVLDPEHALIIGASENTVHILGIEAQDLIGNALSQIAPVLARLLQCLPGNKNTYDVLDIENESFDLDIVTHLRGGRRVVEFVPSPPIALNEAKAQMRLCAKSCTQIMASGTWIEAAQIAAEAIQELTGFARATIHHVLPDGTFEVHAESLGSTLASGIGVASPAPNPGANSPFRTNCTVSDAGARLIMTKGEPIVDLAQSTARVCSATHTKQLREIGVQSAFDCCLMHEGKIWGMATAHNDLPGHVSFDASALVQEVSTALMVKLSQLEQLEITKRFTELRRIEGKFADALRQGHDIDRLIDALVPDLHSLVPADGFALQYGTKLFTRGQTPPPQFVDSLIAWATSSKGAFDHFQTNALLKEWGPAREQRQTASGVLIKPIDAQRTHHLIWFRAPISHKVNWSERLQTEHGSSDTRANDRKVSVHSWMKKHRHHSLRWKEAELDAVNDLMSVFLKMFSALLSLQEDNAALRQFAASAAHDIKAPLRGISMALEIMQEESFDKTVVKETHAIAQNATSRLMNLSSGFLEMAVVSEQKAQFEPTDLDSVVKDACALLQTQIDATKAKVTSHVPCTIEANGQLLLRLVMNLVANALKYRDPDKPQNIDVSLVSDTADHVEIAVADTGMGIENQYADRIFKPLLRLHSHDEIEGSGLGLAICTHIAEAHKGSLRLDKSYKGGARFVLRLPRAANPK